MQEDLESRIERASERGEPLLLIVDDACTIVFESPENSVDVFFECCAAAGELRADIKHVVMELIAVAEHPGADRRSRSAFIAPGHLMRLRRLRSGEQKLYALIVEPFRNRDSVRVAARRYSLTKREHEILTLILEGATALEISSALNITENTAQGYLKRLLKKTNSRNRPAMVANVLEWNREAAAPDPEASEPQTQLVRELGKHQG